MIPLVLAAIGFGVAAYWVSRKLRKRPVTWGGVAAAAVVAGLTGGVGGLALDTLWAAGLFAAEGAVAGEVQAHVVDPVKDFFSDLFDKDEPKPKKDERPVKEEPAPPPEGNDPTLVNPGNADGSGYSGSAIVPSPDDNTIGGTYTVQKGDTIASLARRAHVSENSLIGVNPTLALGAALKEGQVLNIPCPNIDTAGPGGPKSVGCAASIEAAFGQNRNAQNTK